MHSSEFPQPHNPELDTHEWFKQESLALLRTQLQQQHYPGYPTKRLTRSQGVDRISTFGRLYLPNGPWHATGKDEYIDGNMAASFIGQGYRLDADSRPLHPWIEDMLAEDIGVVTGKGFYWNWGANCTADPIIRRTDTPDPLYLFIVRNDTGQLALPGGFVDKNETTEHTAFREAAEETLIDWRPYTMASTPIYEGPLADIRATANAWPETTAHLIDLNPRFTRRLSIASFKGNEAEVRGVHWLTAQQASEHLFGSHKLLIELAEKHV